MNYYTIKNGIYTEHNENIIRQQQNSMRYYQRIDYIFQIKKPNNFAEKMIEFKYQMLNPNTEQSNYNCMNLIRFFFEEDIKFTQKQYDNLPFPRKTRENEIKE